MTDAGRPNGYSDHSGPDLLNLHGVDDVDLVVANLA
jgi:hypothetical protein